MARPALLFATVSLAVVGAAGCGTSASTSTNLTAPSDARCQPSITASASSFGPDGGTGTLSVAVARECAWSAASQASWIAIMSPSQGQGEGTVSYRVAENADPVARQAALTVADRRVELSQQAAPCRFAVDAAIPARLPAGGADVSAAVRTHAVCAWTAASQVPWAQVSPASGRGDGTVRISVTPNAGSERVIQVLVAGVPIAITQAGAGDPSPGPVPSPDPPAPDPPDPDPHPDPEPPPPAPTPDPVPVRPIELEGQVDNLAGSCPDLSFTLRALQIYTTSRTNFRGGPCTRLRNGTEVEIDGTLMSDGTVRADRVTLD